jgi:hypothetical protein
VPRSPAFPPCGTTLFSLQYFVIFLTSSVVRGLSTVVDFYLYFPIQSSLNTVSSSAGAFEGESVDKMEEGVRKLEKWPGLPRSPNLGSMTRLRRPICVAISSEVPSVLVLRRGVFVERLLTLLARVQGESDDCTIDSDAYEEAAVLSINASATHHSTVRCLTRLPIIRISRWTELL